MSNRGCSLHWGGLDKTLEGAAQKIGNRQLLMASIGDALVSETIHRFEKGEAPDGTKWEASERATVQQGKTLVDTGQLRDSIDRAVAGDTVMVGSNKAYARIHQYGGKTSPHVIRPKHKKALAFGGTVVKKVNHPGSDIPARPFLGMSDEDREEIRHIIRGFLAGAFNIRG